MRPPGRIPEVLPFQKGERLKTIKNLGRLFAQIWRTSRMLTALSIGLRVVVARPFNHLGPGQEPRFAASWFAVQIARAEAGLVPPVLKVGNLEPKRDVLDVRDVVRAYLGILDAPDLAGVFNVCSGASTRIGWILDWFIAQSRVPVRVESDPSLFRPMDAPDLRGSSARLRAAIGWAPSIPIEETLGMILDDARRRAEDAAGRARG